MINKFDEFNIHKICRRYGIKNYTINNGKGIYDEELVDRVKSNQHNLIEGVVCKGVINTKSEGNIVWMNKIKCNSWIDKVKLIYGEKALLEEFNGDRTLINF